jgi:hypothetical protein
MELASIFKEIMAILIISLIQYFEASSIPFVESSSELFHSSSLAILRDSLSHWEEATCGYDSRNIHA